MADLLIPRGHMNTYWRHKCRFHFIKYCMDVETADREAGSVWFGYGYDNYNMAFCAFRGHKSCAKICVWIAEQWLWRIVTVGNIGVTSMSHKFHHIIKEESLKYFRFIKNSLF